MSNIIFLLKQRSAFRPCGVSARQVRTNRGAAHRHLSQMVASRLWPQLLWLISHQLQRVTTSPPQLCEYRGLHSFTVLEELMWSHGQALSVNTLASISASCFVAQQWASKYNLSIKGPKKKQGDSLLGCCVVYPGTVYERCTGSDLRGFLTFAPSREPRCTRTRPVCNPRLKCLTRWPPN